jgi:hypothetical protein
MLSDVDKNGPSLHSLAADTGAVKRVRVLSTKTKFECNKLIASNTRPTCAQFLGDIKVFSTRKFKANMELPTRLKLFRDTELLKVRKSETDNATLDHPSDCETDEEST